MTHWEFDLEFDPDNFHVQTPVWVPFSKVGIKSGNTVDLAKVVVIPRDEGPTFLPVFTDEDLADRALTKNRFGDATMLSFSRSEFETLLQRLQEAGVKFVGFDLEIPRVRLATIADALAAIRRGDPSES